ncbi:hypothetical protein WP12_01540 [Sphingomonas sp. SRS2]|nr:hypothetical protein WP12_01540 [Sphingomonas sp. SRS2]
MKALALSAMMAAALAAPAFGAVIVNSSNSGYSFQVDYVGQVNSVTTPSVSALGTFTFNGVTNNGKTYNFGYSLANDSTTTARLSGFAFNTNPNPMGAVVTGAFDNANLSGNYPEGYSTVDVCFNSGGGSCAGGGGGGFYQGNTGTGTFALTFAQAMASVSFDSFVTRFQSINGVSGGTSGIGIGSVVQPGGPITAPEPGTWLMMLGGFGLVGMTLRGKRRQIPTLQAA